MRVFLDNACAFVCNWLGFALLFIGVTHSTSGRELAAHHVAVRKGEKGVDNDIFSLGIVLKFNWQRQLVSHGRLFSCFSSFYLPL